MKKLLGAIGVCVMAAGCVPDEELLYQTRSGSAEADCPGTKEEVSDALLGGLADRGLNAELVSTSKIRAYRREDNPFAAVACPRYSQIYQVGEFQLIGQGDSVRVVARSFLECQTAFGQTQRIESTRNQTRNDFQRFLWGAGCKRGRSSQPYRRIDS